MRKNAATLTKDGLLSADSKLKCIRNDALAAFKKVSQSIMGMMQGY